MREAIEFETTPSNEDCAAVGRENYTKYSCLEARALEDQIVRQFAPVPPGVRIRLKANPHDFGTYFTLVLSYEEEDIDAREFCEKVEDKFPDRWDDDAIFYLKRNQYPLAKDDALLL